MINVLVTEAGGIGALNIIKCLREDKSIRIIATDVQKWAVGLYKADKKYTVPRVDNTNYFDAIFEICEKESVDIVFPSYDYFILTYSKNKKLFEERGISMIISDLDTMEITLNKLLTYKKLKGVIPIAKTYSFSDLKNKNIDLFPLFMKPIRGGGAIDVHKINSQEELILHVALHKNEIENFCFQEYLGGTEYTVDVLCDLKGNVLAVVPRIRLQTKAGASVKGITFRNIDMEKMAKKIAERLKFIGPICFQVKADTITDELKLIEINPRICGTMILSKAAGVNMPLLAVKMAMGEQIQEKELEYKEGVVMLRYWEEIYLNRQI